MVWFLGAILAATSLILLLDWWFPGALSGTDDKMQFAYGVALLALVGSSVFLGMRANLKETVQSLLVWTALGLALVISYTYADAFKAAGANIAHAISPGTAVDEGDSVSIRVSSGGHFVTHAKVNDARIRFLIDTGATRVVLTRADAKRAGFPVQRLQYTDFVQTANGLTQVAPVRLKQVTVGSITMRNVAAEVAGDGLDHSLLGMSFLSRLSSYEFSSRELILRE